MSKGVLLLGICILVSIGCENAEVRKSSELESLRILGLKLSPHVIELDKAVDSLSVEIIGFETSKASDFEWTLCASLGAVDRFECLPDTPTLTGRSDAHQWAIPFSTAVFAEGTDLLVSEFEFDWIPPICPDYELLACADQSECSEGAICIAEGCRSPTEVFPIQLVLRVVPFMDEEEMLPAAVTIPIRATTATNTAIKIDSLTLDGQAVTSPLNEAGCHQVAMTRPQRPLILSVDVAEESIDAFQSEEDGLCIQRTERETGIVSWFSKGASIQTSVTDLETPETSLEIEANGETPVVVYGVLRDGRGSLDARCLVINFD